MDDQNEKDLTPFDAEWEIAKMRGSFTDILNMIEELKAKDRVLSSRISRLKIASIEEAEEEPGTPEDEERDTIRREVEDMTLEQRAVLYAKLLDQQTPTET